MLKRYGIGVALVGLTLTLPAFADNCASDVQAIDEALEADPKLNAKQLEAVRALRDEGEELYQAGHQKESAEALHEAMKLLGVEHK